MENANLDQLRAQIEQIDAKIIRCLAERQEISQKIGELKAQTGMSIVDKKREVALLQYYEELCRKYQLSFPFVKQLFEVILLESQRLQKSKVERE